jgi:hypothetical protein
VSAEAYAWKTTLGQGRTRPDSLTATYVASMAHVCRVVRLFPLQGLNWFESPRLPSDMGNTCLLLSFSSNSTFIMLYLLHGMDIDYLVVDEMINIKIV